MVKKELLGPGGASKKAKSARFQVAQVGDEDKKKRAVEEDTEDQQMTHQGSHQFTQYAKSFRHYLTRDVLPSESNYRNLLSFNRHSGHKRPTMAELREEEQMMMTNKEVRTRYQKGVYFKLRKGDPLNKVRNLTPIPTDTVSVLSVPDMI